MSRIHAKKSHPQASQAMRPWSLLFFLVYAVQKSSNHFEGLSKIPVRKVLKTPQEQGGYGLTPDQAGSFLTDSALGWYIKALFGLITDNLPIFGYRRKSWLIISSLLAGGAWFWVAANGTTLQLLLVGLMMVNILVAFSDVVCDGLMVETAQRFEHRFALPAGTANRPFQAAQWSGAMFAVLVSAVGGGVIAQFFDLTLAAVISGVLPMGLAVVMAFVVREEKVRLDRQRARKGLLAIAVIVIVALVILQLKDLAADNPLKPFEPVVSALLIIACLLLFIRIPRDLIAPIVLVFCWQAAPFNTDAQYIYQYFTQHNTEFLDALNKDQTVVPLLRSLTIYTGLADNETIATQGFQDMFWGSVLGALFALFAILGALVYRRLWQTTPFISLFYWCLAGQAGVMLLFLPFPLLGWSSPIWLMLLMALQGFVFIIVLLAMLGFAAKRTPGENQASFFAFLMGMSNLGQMLGIEQVGNRLYTAFAGKTTQWGNAVESTTIVDPHAGLTGVILVSLVYLLFLTVLVVWMSRHGQIVTHPEDTEHVF